MGARPTLLMLFAIIPLLAACAGGAARSSGTACALSSADSVHLAGGPVYRECHVDAPARLQPGSRQLDFRPPMGAGPPPGPACFSAEVEVVVDATGRVEEGTARIVRTNDRALADALIRSIPGWRYRPAEFQGAPVRQIVLEQAAVAVIVTSAPAGQAPARPTAPTACRR